MEINKSHYTLTSTHFAQWLNEYKAAWELRDPLQAANLFADNAQYFETPFDPPAKGKAKIREYWEAVPEGQEDVNFEAQIICVLNNVGWCKWQASFTRKQSQEYVHLDGIFEVAFDSTGKCTVFREWWHRKEKPEDK